MSMTIKVNLPYSELSQEKIVVTITESDIRTSLEEQCELSCGQCDSDCPVYRANGGKVPLVDGQYGMKCKCLRDGNKMLEFLRKQLKKGVIA